MSAPVVERPRAGGTRTATAAPRTATRTGAARTAPRTATQPAAARPRPQRAPQRSRSAARTATRAVAPGRAQFVLTVMVLLGIGLVATLWLSTAAAADSYRLQDARAEARDLSERSERLHRDVAALQSPPALAQRATELGMVPAKDPARLVVAPDGTSTVVGEPTAAVAPPAAAAPPGLGGGVPPVTAATPSGTSVGKAPQSVFAAAIAAVTPVAEEAGGRRGGRGGRGRATDPA